MTGILTTILIITGLMVAIAGIIGCIIPVLPGPILGFTALVILAFAKNWQVFSPTFLIVTGLLALLVTGLDYIVPAMGAKKYGASKLGIWGFMIGLVVGLFFFPPWGVLIGGFVGAITGELATGKESKTALRVGWGIFIGNMAGMGLKLIFTITLTVIYIVALF